MNNLTKKYQLWYYCEGGYQLKEYDTLIELFDELPNYYTKNYYITTNVKIKIEEVAWWIKIVSSENNMINGKSVLPKDSFK